MSPSGRRRAVHDEVAAVFERVGDVGLDRADVVGVDLFEKGLERRAERLRRVAVDAVELVGPRHRVRPRCPTRTRRCGRSGRTPRTAGGSCRAGRRRRLGRDAGDPSGVARSASPLCRRIRARWPGSEPGCGPPWTSPPHADMTKAPAAGASSYCSCVGVTGIEPVTSSVSGRRSPAELNAREW